MRISTRISTLMLSLLVLMLSVSATLTRMECNMSGRVVYSLMDSPCCETPLTPQVQSPCCHVDDLGVQLDEVTPENHKVLVDLPVQTSPVTLASMELQWIPAFTTQHLETDLPPPDNKPSFTILFNSFLC